MIRIKGYGLFNRLSFAFFSIPLLGVTVWMAINILKIDDLEAKLILGFIIIIIILDLFGFMVFIWWDLGRSAVGADYNDNQIQFVMMTGRVRVIECNRIVKIIKTGHGYRLVDDQRRSYILTFVFWPKSPYNPWKELITYSRFQNAEFKEQLSYW